MDKKISSAVIRRLPRYYRYLATLMSSNVKRISSAELSKLMDVTASQVRQDFNCFGGFGQQGYGYNVENLYNEIGKIIGINEMQSVVIIGAGHLGSAIANYTGFEKRGFFMAGIFDIDQSLEGLEIRKLKVLHMDKLADFVEATKITIAALCVPKENAADVADRLADLGIKGIWNFSSVDLHVADKGVIVENAHLSDTLMVLGYRLKINN